MKYITSSFIKKSLKFTITFKLLMWSFTLIFIFLVTTLFVLMQTQDVVNKSQNIVTVHYDVVDRSEKLIQNVLTLLEHKRKYEILKKDQYKAAYRENLASFRDHLQNYLSMPAVSNTHENLPQEKRSDVQAVTSSSDSDESIFLDEKLMYSWIDTLSAIRKKHRTAVMSELEELRDEGNSAVRTGLFGLGASFAAGVIGSFLLAFFMNRSTRELKKGIQRMGQNGDYQPVRVLSRDELGDLTEVFNRMAHRLKHEDERRSDFISMLSHEIRTPLTSIKECLSMLRDGTTGSVNQEQKHLLDVSHQETDRLTTQLNRLMFVSSLESQELQLLPQIFQAVDLVRKSQQRTSPLAQRKKIALEQDVDPELEAVGDGEHIQQVLINLIANAVKFSPEASTVRLRAYADTDGHTAVFAVEDEGPGIPEEEQPYVFDKYFRASSSKDKMDGAGLGLHISKRIVLEHGGRMWVENSKHGGSVFTFTLTRHAKA
ncbi:MAG: HAMP domain-containing sensor histidine kinase [Desulfohalobiaceae bacterium]